MPSDRRDLPAAALAALTLAGCAAAPPPPAVLVACEVDVTSLYRCETPVLPESPAEGIVVLAGALARCELAARAVIEQVERRAGAR